MSDEILDFYEELADHYHLLFDDWDSAIQRQAHVLERLLAAQGPALNILDCACGIGTQALGLAARGHRITGSDLSPAAVARASIEARSRGLAMHVAVSNMTSLGEIEKSSFDVVMAMDNALPHLAGAELRQAIAAIASKLRAGGIFMASLRDYDRLVVEKPAMQPPAFYGSGGSRRIVHQVWDWVDDRTYVPHLYITVESGGGWKTRHFTSLYHCLLRDELSSLLLAQGFEDVRWILPEQSGFYQPIVMARRAVTGPSSG